MRFFLIWVSLDKVQDWDPNQYQYPGSVHLKITHRQSPLHQLVSGLSPTLMLDLVKQSR